MKLKWLIAFLFLGIIFLSPAFGVMGSTLGINQDSSEESETETSESETEEETEEKSEDKEDETNEAEDDEKEEEDTDDDGVEDDREKAEERELKVDLEEDNTKLKVESKLKSGETKNEYKFELEADSRVEFDFEYKSETDNAESEVHTKFEFRYLVEFVDNSSNPDNIVGGLDGNDTIIQEIDFHDLEWTISYSDEIIGGNTVYTIITTAQDGNMTITFTFFVTSGYTLLDGNSTLLQPSSVKFDVEIENFNFLELESNLAVEMKLKHKTESETDEEIEDETEDESDNLANHDEQQLKFTNQSVDAFFSWITSYEADGENKTIIVSPVVDDDDDSTSKRKMYFNFVQAKKIYWDPKVGVTRATTSPYVPATGSAYGFELIMVLLSIPIVGLLRKRNRND